MRCTASTSDGCFAASGALSYTTLVSLVPLGVIGLGVLSAFPNLAGSREELLQLLFRNFVPGISEQAAWWFQYFAGSAAQATAIGIVGTAAVGVLLLVTVEDQLNAVWRVTVPRPWVQRILAYWTLITMGPMLVGTSLTLSTYLNHAARRAGLDPDAIAQFASGWPHLLGALRAVPARMARLRAALYHHPELRRALARRDARRHGRFRVDRDPEDRLRDLYRLAVVVSDRLRRDRHDPDLSAVDVRVVDGGAARRGRRREPADLEGGRAVSII